ncbi:MAG: LacI family DNA-binding transcriptional regulator [Pseudomonadota bacterium]
MPRTPKTAPPAAAAGGGARPRLADIARMADVTISTVSRALANNPLVKEETRTRIHEIATALNYSANAAAQNLRTGQSRTIGVVVPLDPASRDPVSAPFLLGLLGGIIDALTERGYDMLISRISVDRLDRVAQLFDSRRAEGIIMIGQWGYHDHLNKMTERGVPLVVWGSPLPHQKYVTVGSDNALGGELVTGHLLDQGARRVAFFGDNELNECRLRYQGYLNAHKQRGLMVDPALTRSLPFVGDSMQQEVGLMLAQGLKFDSAFGGSDMVALQVIAGLHAAGLRVPEDILVAGYDNIAPAAYAHPALTTVHQPMQDAGQSLVDCLMTQIEGRQAHSVMLSTSLVTRESTQRH